MVDVPNGDAEQPQSADVKLAGPGLRFLAWFSLALASMSVIAGIAIPILREQQIKANEAAAIDHINTITGTQVGFSAAQDIYLPSFEELTADTINSPGFLLGEWYDGVEKDGYIFTMKGVGVMDVTYGGCRFTLCYETTAFPAIPGRTGKRYFFSDCSGVIRANEGAPADSTSTPVAKYDRYSGDAVAIQ